MENFRYKSEYLSPLGPMTMAGDGECLTGLWFDGQKYFPAPLLLDSTQASLPVFDQTCVWLDRYFAGENPGPVPPLRLAGTPFRQAVWRLLQEIPHGQVVTYRAIARQLSRLHGGARVSAQAVGGAVGHNPVSIVVPCHRVVGGDGRLTGYAGGLDRKASLLRDEGVGCEKGICLAVPGEWPLADVGR
ncbi:methylated-DNA--[protein]-cysteine S-methyltransferase [Barnesiella viscericola]|uniref:methylated-DNA--[protein]-cysteine S-methyltransferase n=1 Tax=Barnesiella viscericola TaxID=397865 RepID=UPI00320AA1C3